MQRGDFLQRLETNLDIFDDRNAVFGVAIDRQHIGEIESVNTAGRRQFGYVQSSDLVGHNIHKIIPSPLADIHDDLLTDYLNRNESRILNTTRVAFALHKAGHIFPINLFIRWADQANGKMVGVLQAIDDTHDVHLMIDHKTRAVTYCTLPCYHLFGLSREKIIGREVAIHDILPTLLDREDLDRTERSWEQIGTKSGLACSARHIGSRFEFPVQAWIISVVIATTTITFVRLHIDEVFDEDDEDGLSNIDDLADDSPEAALRRRLSGSDDEDGARSRTTGVADGSRGRGLLAGLADDTDNTSTYSSSVAAANAAAKSALAAVAVAAAPTPAAAGGMSARSATNGLSARPNGQSARGSAGHRGGRASGGALGVSDSELAQTAAAAASGAINQHTAEMDNMTRKRRSHRRAMRAYDFGGTHSNAGTDAETESRLTGDTNGSATTGRVGRKGHKRLMRVIESENAKTEAGLSRMSRFFALLIVLVWVIAIAIFVTTTTYVGIVRRQTAYVHDVTERMSHVQTAVTHVRTLALNNDDTNDLLALPSSVMPVTTTSLRNQISTSLYDIASLVQSMPQPLDHVVTPALRALFDDPTNVVSIRLGDYIVKDFAGLTEAARTFSAYLFFTTISATPINLNRDINQHYILVNGQDAIPYAYVSASAIARRALDTEAATLLTINIILACVSVGIVVAVLLILVRPIIRHIEQGKAQVLEMFLDIPRHTRRTLRRRVYGLMKDEGEEAIDLAEATNQVAATSLYDHDDDDGHTVAGEESVVYGNAQSVVGPPPASATQRYRRMRTTTAGGASVPDEPAEINVNLAKMSHSIRNKAQEADRQPLAGGLGGPTSSNVLEDKKESKEDLERMDQQTVAESTSDRNMRILVAKYAFLIIYVMVYMIVIVVLTSQRIDQVSSMTKTVEYASRRVPVLQRSFIYIREHLFNDYDDLVTNQPLSSLISPMSFAEEARVALEKFNNFHQSVVYGNKGLGLETPPFNEIQNALLYDDACISEDVELDILLPPNYHVNCPAFMGGMLRNGLQAGLISAENYLVGLRSPEAKAVYAHLVGGPANTNYPPGSPAYISLKAVFVQLSSLLQDFVVPAMQYSSRVYSESAISHMRQFKVFRIVFLICFILLLLLLYIVVYNPIIQKLNQSARQTRAMMLVLPPDVVKIVPSVQKFITDNMQ
jgi:PAS domain S-box-containing protein